jgi:DNA replication and repair protein RecF
MVIEKLTVLNFKNYDHAEFNFSKAINLITGLNGSGKTNLLDAIHYISLTKSAFNTQDVLNIQSGKPYFSIQSQISNGNEKHSVLCNLIKGQKKQIKVDKTLFTRASEYIGKFPAILITPYDTDLVREGSIERRRFFDTLISQIDQAYLQDLILYNQHLKQRNSALKIFYQTNRVDQDLIDYYNLKMLGLGEILFTIRKKFVEEFAPIFQKYYQVISHDKDDVSLRYQSHCLSENFEEEFTGSLERDIALQRTSKGIHKDDFLFEIKKVSLKNFGSQGQQKSFVIALKIAQYHIIKERKGFDPVLLLDDIFDKLDDERIHKLLELISSGMFGQIFITDASLERLQKYIGSISSEMIIFKIHNGSLIHE